jgi:uncharacterized protein with HEPN domain
MPLPELRKSDIVRLRHMLDAARQAIDFTSGRNRDSLDSDPMFRRAVVSCIQGIGEAAVRVDSEARALLPTVPWRQIVEMRNRLVHAYFDINHQLVWEVLMRDLQPLITALETALA